MSGNRSIIASAVLAAGLIAALGGPVLAQNDTASLHQAARQEGSVAWCNGSFPDASAQKVIAAFKKKFPGIEINSLRASSQVAYQRLMQDLENRMHNCDVFGSGDGSHFTELAKRGDLMEYVPAAAKSIDSRFDDLYQAGLYYPATVFLMVMAYNKDKVAPSNAPTNWTDLLDAKWKGQVAIAHPAFSGNIGNWAVFMQQLYGSEFFQKLYDNNPLVGRSSGDPVAQLASGERLIGIAPMATAFVEIQKGAPVEVVYPSDGSLVVVTHMGILKQAPHPNAAKLFMEFILGPEVGAIVTSEGRHSLNPSIPVAPGVKRIDEIKAGWLTAEQVNTGIPPIVEKWNAIFGG